MTTTNTDTILLVGDSHSNIFASYPGVEHFATPVVCTAQRFADTGFEPLWHSLAQYFERHRGSRALVVSVGEIDIRVHSWRHLPQYMACDGVGSLSNYAQSRAQELYTALLRVQSKYDLGSVVLWGAPPAMVNTGYDRDWPFCGSVSTRNQIIHAFNRAFAEVSENNPTVNLASGYYEYMDMSTWSADAMTPSDGVHWHHSLADTLWYRCIVPAFDQGSGVVLPDVDVDASSGRLGCQDCVRATAGRYDAWVRGSYPGLYKTLDFDGDQWTLLPDSSDLRPDVYQELVLV